MIRATRLALLAATLTLGAGAVWADKLDDVKNAGVLRVAEGLTTMEEVIAATPPLE